MGTCLFSFSIDQIVGSIAEERRKGNTAYINIKKNIKAAGRLNKKLSYHSNLYNIVCDPTNDFINQVSLETAEHPELPLDFSIRGLRALEGKNSQKRTLQLLMFLSDLPDSKGFILDIVLEKIIGGYFHRKEENLGKIGLEIIQLLRVFGRYEVRQAYLRKRYSKRKLLDNKQRGAVIAKSLNLRIFNDSMVKELKRRRGYSDHGSKRPRHEYHGEKEHDIIFDREEEKLMDKRSVSEILSEIYKESTLNYLNWLKGQTNQVEEITTENLEGDQPSKVKEKGNDNNE